MDPSVVTSFLVLIVSVSMGAERMVEILKGLLPGTWLFTPNQDADIESRRCALITILAALCGVVIAAMGKIDIFRVIGVQGWQHSTALDTQLYWAASWLITGGLASGGSAFWNHTLDLVKATKVQQEQKAGLEPQILTPIANYIRIEKQSGLQAAAPG